MTRVKVIIDLMESFQMHQGNDEYSCRLISKRNQNNQQIDDTIEVALKGTTNSENKATSLDCQLVASTSKQNCADSMDVDTSNIGVQTTTENKGGTPKVGVDAPQVGSGKKLMDTGQKLIDTSDVKDAKNSRQQVLQVENENPTKNWTLGPAGNFHDSEKSQDISNASKDLLCSNNFDALLKTTRNQANLEALVFVPKCVLAKKNESRALVSNTIDLGKDSLQEDDEANMMDICFYRVARKGDISPRQQRNGRNKRKKKTHGRQHSWNGKMTEEFVPRHLQMRQAKQNHLTVSIG
ncbi:hypothetical protein H5410_015733 [Solanum commersonii]|uniref:Uncharacterized protein n=1 Tax=Solanum commersonii TaxID=4109 RepID=A0A9J5ZUB3_SOLCO|nr:hypothetical protein H5410_015733 [Solanum commersonii]